MLQTVDLTAWVDMAPDEEEEKLRQTMHICLYAIASNDRLKDSMYIKGGILLAVKYHSDRYTRDIDFSTQEKVGDKDVASLLEVLESSLIDAGEVLPYNIATCINSHSIKPAHKPNASFPTLEINIGYAVMGTPEHNRMIQNGQSTSVISIDYSFNEHIETTDIVQIDSGHNILAYSLTDLIAEKYRAVLQQPIRKRNRRQDIYDLWMIICEPGLSGDVQSQATKELILKTLINTCRSRGIKPIPFSLDQQEIYDRSRKEFNQLKHEIGGELPSFDEAFSIVKSFYESLPWSNKTTSL